MLIVAGSPHEGIIRIVESSGISNDPGGTPHGSTLTYVVTVLVVTEADAGVHHGLTLTHSSQSSFFSGLIFWPSGTLGPSLKISGTEGAASSILNCDAKMG